MLPLKDKSHLYIGVMSGTSADGIDAVISEISPNNTVKTIHFLSSPYSATIRREVLDIFTPGENEIERMGALDVKLGRAYAQTINQLLIETHLSQKDIIAIGCHGQTIRHRPPSSKYHTPFTLQIGDPNTVAQLTGIPTVADLRRSDIALGGEGAPLVPGFHHAVFGDSNEHRCIINIGGIANITCLIDDNITGFDTGPGNALMDNWVKKHKNTPYDHNGDFARTGKICEQLLNNMLEFSYFSDAPPKSTGREMFTQTWLHAQLNQTNTQKIAPEDIQATLTELTATTIAQAVQANAPDAKLYCCGGGVNNRYLMERISANLAKKQSAITLTNSLGIHAQWVEATAFAWLAKQRIEQKTSSIPSVTGAKRPAILGALYLP